jgi:hypothetical protein
MDLISPFLYRLHDSVGRFVGPSAAFQDIPTIKAQIELRQLVLKDIEAIRSRLRPFVVREKRESSRRRLRGRCSPRRS